MFSLFKRDPIKALRQKYDAKAEQAMLAQRKGDMRLFADLTAEAEELIRPSWKNSRLNKTKLKLSGYYKALAKGRCFILAFLAFKTDE